jgi:hypothetical protein
VSNHTVRKDYDGARAGGRLLRRHLPCPRYCRRYEASSLLLALADKPIWLNEDISLEHLASAGSSQYRVDNVARLKWLSTESIYHGVVFDHPESNMYSIELALEPYNSLLRACGTKGFNSLRPTFATENVENHSANTFNRIKLMHESHRRPTFSSA